MSSTSVNHPRENRLTKASEATGYNIRCFFIELQKARLGSNSYCRSIARHSDHHFPYMVPSLHMTKGFFDVGSIENNDWVNGTDGTTSIHRKKRLKKSSVSLVWILYQH